MANNSDNEQNKKGNNAVLVMIAVVLFFLAICWGIWWFFDYKIRTTEVRVTVITMLSSIKK